GDIHPSVLRAMDIDGPAVGFIVNLQLIPASRNKRGAGGSALRPLLNLSPFQAVHRDFAFVVDAKTESGDLLRAVRSADTDLIIDASIFDVYEGERLEDGKKSIAISITLQPVEATLTDEEIDAVADKVTAAVKKRTGGVLRGRA
ncbi:MAG: phenylalanine--tRNA ligase subunit beta, partial [Pseudomonadota bacterium]|nr:phenylalanine--tRNA ligase subunit beta [Pseudomonadota bacterium]